MNTNLTDIENRLWRAADELRANSRLKASEYSTPVLGLIFLRYADHKFTQAEQEISSEADPNSRRHPDLRMECQARGVLYLPSHSRFQYLLNLPEGENIGQAVTDAMKAIEAENSQIEGSSPKLTIDLKRIRSSNSSVSWNRSLWTLKETLSGRFMSTSSAISP